MTNGQCAYTLAEALKRNDLQHGDFSQWFEYQKDYPSTLPGHCLSKRSIDSGDRAPRGQCLLRYDVLGLRTFLTVCDGELNLLTVCQGLETIALNRAEVYKDVWPIFLSDEAVALCFIEPLHGARNC